jgi:Protein of unknown function (DUF1236)
MPSRCRVTGPRGLLRGGRISLPETASSMPRSEGGAVVLLEIAVKKLGLVALSTAALMAGISVASAGAPVSRDSTDLPGAKTSDSKTPATGAAPSADALKLSDAQRKMAWQDLYMDSLNQDTPPGFNAVVGATVPNTIVIAPVTAQAGGDVPALKPYAFAMVQKKLVIVNPGNRKIANVIAQ